MCNALLSLGLSYHFMGENTETQESLDYTCHRNRKMWGLKCTSGWFQTIFSSNEYSNLVASIPGFFFSSHQRAPKSWHRDLLLIMDVRPYLSCYFHLFLSVFCLRASLLPTPLSVSLLSSLPAVSMAAWLAAAWALGMPLSFSSFSLLLPLL